MWRRLISRGPTQRFGWHYLFNAICLIRPHMLYALFVVSRIITICDILRHCLKKSCVRQVVLDKWFPARDAMRPVHEVENGEIRELRQSRLLFPRVEIAPRQGEAAEFIHLGLPIVNPIYEEFTRLAETRLAQNALNKLCKVIYASEATNTCMWTGRTSGGRDRETPQKTLLYIYIYIYIAYHITSYCMYYIVMYYIMIYFISGCITFDISYYIIL